MKLFRKSIYPGLAACGLLALATACSEDNTLSGAKEVYISLNPAAVTLSLGDTVKVSASVSNISGDEIDTPIAWSVDDADVARIVEFRDTVFEIGDTVFTSADSTAWYIPRNVKSIGEELYYGVVATPGAQGRATKMRATLANGKFAVGTVSVTNHSPKGVNPVAETVRTYRPSSVEVIDTVWFTVEPWAIVSDYVPTAKLEKTDEGPSQLELADDPIIINEKARTIGVKILPDRSHGNFRLTLSVGGNGDVATGSANVTVCPKITVGMWDADPAYGMSAPSGDQFYGFNYEVRKTIDINTDVQVYARLMVEGGRQEDVANARGSYSWEVESGNSLLITGKEERNNEYGFDCVLTLRSGITPGENVINFCSPDTIAPVMTAYITVLDFNKDFPVNDIIVTPANGQPLDGLTVSSKANLELDVKVDPLTSLAYHRPTVEIANPSVLSFQSFSGTLLILSGENPGTTTVTLKSLDVTKVLTVTVTDEVVEMNWASALERMVAGQEDNFKLSLRTASGQPWTQPITWKSSNTKVLTVTGSGETATVKAIADGKATITATTVSAAGKTTTLTREVTVAAGLDDIIVSDATIGRTGDAGYYADGSRYGFYVSLPDHGYNNIWIYTKQLVTDFNGLMAASIFDGASIDGSSATVTASSLTISGYNATTGEATASGEISLSMGGAAVKLVFQNATLYYQP